MMTLSFVFLGEISIEIAVPVDEHILAVSDAACTWRAKVNLSGASRPSLRMAGSSF